MSEFSKEEILKHKADSRTPEQLKEELKRAIEEEKKIISEFELILKMGGLKSYSFVPTGSDGVELDENNQVADIDLFPDYLIKYKTEDNKMHFSFIEIKISRPKSKEAYFKVKALMQYRELGNVIILFVMGFQEKNPEFILIRPEQIFNLKLKPELVYGKETFKVPYSYFEWHPFKFDFKNKLDLLSYNFILPQYRK